MYMPRTNHIFFTTLIVGALFCFSLLPQSLHAQGGDSAKVKVHHHPPAKAMVMSIIFPGLGQIYNHRYWKLPIIYVGLGVDAYFFVSNLQTYNNYHSALVLRDNGGMDQYYNLYSSDELSDIVSYYRRNLDLTVIVALGIYILNIVDANVDAQLHGFDVSDDISLHFTPNLIPNPMNGMMSLQPGFTLVKRF
jgi:hypothetical protein